MRALVFIAFPSGGQERNAKLEGAVQGGSLEVGVKVVVNVICHFNANVIVNVNVNVNV